jgi:tetratricopeptide (TPR) repeat protein
MSLEVQILLRNSLEHIQAKEYGVAKELLLKAKSLDPLNPDVLRFLSVVAALQYDHENALILIDQCIVIAPSNGIAHSNRGNILKELERYDEALIALDKSLALSPNYAEAYNNKGNVLQALHRYENALPWYDKAISLAPAYAEAYSNKGNCFGQLRRYKDAMECYYAAISINPQFAECYWSMAALQLAQGELELGWKNYEARWFIDHPIAYLYANVARLENTEDVAGKKILIWSEQGLGDTIQFCRYIKKLSDLGAQLTFKVQEPLLNVLGKLSKYCRLVPNGEVFEESQFDSQSPLLSLPLVFGTTLETIPAQIPYLDFDHDKKNLFARELGTSQKLKVGVIWNGGFRADSPELWAINKRRNIELDVICRLKNVKGVDFYSLQKGDPAESELRTRKEELWPDLINYADLLNDFSDTAALMECLDLIISVDTSSAHLAGALGRPVWILNRYDSCWRWLRGRSDSPWYPTAKIYQQNTPGDWIGVIEDVKVDLASLAAAHSKR